MKFWNKLIAQRYWSAIIYFSCLRALGNLPCLKHKFIKSAMGLEIPVATLFTTQERIPPNLHEFLMASQEGIYCDFRIKEIQEYCLMKTYKQINGKYILDP